MMTPATKVSTRALAAELANLWLADARFVVKRGRWYFWDGSGWRRDDKLLLMRAREFMAAKIEERPDKATLGNPTTLKSVLWSARQLLAVERVRDLGVEAP